MGVSLHGGTPKTPQNDQNTPKWSFLVGKTMLGTIILENPLSNDSKSKLNCTILGGLKKVFWPNVLFKGFLTIISIIITMYQNNHFSNKMSQYTAGVYLIGPN